MFCVKCGIELLGNIQFCPKCGNAVNSIIINNENSTERKRHGFTSFWLIFGVIAYAINGGMFLFIPNIMTKSWNVSSSGPIMFYIFLNLAELICNVLLLHWKKIGFWILIGTSVASFLFNILIIGKYIIVLSLFGLIIGIAVMWGVLHLRKNGRTAWEQLE
jgi:hypothetical protein